MHTHLGAAAQWPRTLSPRARAHFPLITTIRSGRSVRPSAPQSSFRCGRKEGRKEGWKERRGSEMLTGRWGRLLPGERGNDLCRCCILHSSRGARAIFSLCAMADNRDCAHARARAVIWTHPSLRLVLPRYKRCTLAAWTAGPCPYGSPFTRCDAAVSLFPHRIGMAASTKRKRQHAAM